jgi:hypothetical protein
MITQKIYKRNRILQLFYISSLHFVGEIFIAECEMLKLVLLIVACALSVLVGQLTVNECQ